MTREPKGHHEKSVLPCLDPETSDFHPHKCKAGKTVLFANSYDTVLSNSLFDPNCSHAQVCTNHYSEGYFSTLEVGKSFHRKILPKNKDGFQMDIHIKYLLHTLIARNLPGLKAKLLSFFFS